MLASMLWMTVFHALIFGVMILVVLLVSRYLSRRDRLCPKCGGPNGA